MIETIQLIKHKIQKIFFLIFYHSSFAIFEKKSTIMFPFKINGARFISISRQVHISEGAWILALKINKNNPKITIGKGTYIGRFIHLVGVSKIEIRDNVLISDKVYISDNSHEYKDLSVPIKDQKILELNQVVIGENSWIGENVCVIGASVGKHCVIGANSVVLSDIPDYSIAVGSPAIVIKKYDTSTGNWQKVNK